MHHREREKASSEKAATGWNNNSRRRLETHTPLAAGSSSSSSCFLFFVFFFSSIFCFFTLSALSEDRRHHHICFTRWKCASCWSIDYSLIQKGNGPLSCNNACSTNTYTTEVLFCFKSEQPIWCSHAGYQWRAEKGVLMTQYEHACVTHARPVPGFTNTNPHDAAIAGYQWRAEKRCLHDVIPTDTCVTYTRMVHDFTSTDHHTLMAVLTAMFLWLSIFF